MKYAYIVYRYCVQFIHGTPMPVLGVHSNYKSAKQHFDHILEDRKERGNKIYWVNKWDNLDNSPRMEIWEAYIEHKDGERETLKLDRWPYKRRK